jgi:hypothetical protein
MLGQRIYGLCLGWADVCDHNALRNDLVLQTAVGRDQALASAPTLSRLETAATPGQAWALHRVLLEQFIASRRGLRRAPRELVLDVDATHVPLHGAQERSFFHGYYDNYCYLPLYVFCGRHLLAAKLRRSNLDASAGALAEVERIVAQIRARWPRVKIVLRADSGFARDPLMTWGEANAVDYVFGLARNERLVGTITEELAAAEAESLAQGGSARCFADFSWRTLDSWSRERRVVAKAEHLPKGSNPRFVVTSLSAAEIDARTLYEQVYCARGEVENRIKEQQLDLFAGRTSAATMRANQLRLWFASFAYVLIEALRRIGLRFTQFADATCGTIRLKLLKIGAQVRRSVRRIKVAMASACPFQAEYRLAYLYLKRAAAF